MGTASLMFIHYSAADPGRLSRKLIFSISDPIPYPESNNSTNRGGGKHFAPDPGSESATLIHYIRFRTVLTSFKQLKILAVPVSRNII
jgi:hypothetical protein